MSIYLLIKTNSLESVVSLFDGIKEINKINWQADKQLSESLHKKIIKILESSNLSIKDLNGIAIYRGPGSFTGLRIGISSANALASALNIPIIGGSGDDWQNIAINCLMSGQNDKIVFPIYDSSPKVTQPVK